MLPTRIDQSTCRCWTFPTREKVRCLDSLHSANQKSWQGTRLLPANSISKRRLRLLLAKLTSSTRVSVASEFCLTSCQSVTTMLSNKSFSKSLSTRLPCFTSWWKLFSWRALPSKAFWKSTSGYAWRFSRSLTTRKMLRWTLESCFWPVVRSNSTRCLKENRKTENLEEPV